MISAAESSRVAEEASTALAAGDFQEAGDLYQTLVEQLDKEAPAQTGSSARLALIHALSGLGFAYDANGQSAASTAALTRAISLARRSESPRPEAEVHLAQALIAMRNGQTERAQNELDEAIALFSTARHPTGIMIGRTLSEQSSNPGGRADQRGNDELERENRRLQTANQALTSELAGRRWQTTGLILLLALALLGAALLARNWQHARKSIVNLRKMETADPLTGLLNRHAILDKANEEWQRAKRFQRPLACIVVDITNLEEINNRIGERAGDHILKTVAQAIKADLRLTDSLGRYSGESMLLLAPETSAEGAKVVADRIYQHIQQNAGSGLPFSKLDVVIGIADSAEAKSAEDTIHLAKKQAVRH